MDTNLSYFDVTKNLPSKFLPYPEGCSIKYRPFTFGEIKSFSQSKLTLKSRIEFMLEGIETSFPKQDLTYPDFEFILILRKYSTVGAGSFYIDVPCGGCKKELRVIFDLSKIEFDDLECKALPVRTTVGVDKELVFWPLTIGKYLEFYDNKKAQEMNTELAILSYQVSNMPFEEAYNVIYNLSGEDITVVQRIDNLLYHGVKNLEKVCDSEDCGYRNSVDISEEDVIFYPFRVGERPVEDRICFG